MRTYTHRKCLGTGSRNRERNVLTLEERVKVLKKVDEGKSCRAISSELGVGKTQVQERDDIMKRWESGECSIKKYVKPKLWYALVYRCRDDVYCFVAQAIIY